MKRIASFQIDHNKLKRGIYVSRIDGDVITYDIRMKEPNKGDYLENGALHTFEHLFATYLRNSSYAKSVIYIGPMGCRTGFYMILRDDVPKDEAIKLVRESFEFISEFTGDIPGASKSECGNYKEHDLTGARRIADEMQEVLTDWNEERLIYEK